MLNTYICTETWYADQCDDNGMLTDDTFEVSKGSVWREDTEDMRRMCGGPDSIRLERIDSAKTQWLEITDETLELFFERINYTEEI